MVNLGEAYRKDEQKTNKRRCEPHGQIEKRRIKDDAIRMGRYRKDEGRAMLKRR